MKFKRLHKIVMILTCILLIAGCTSPSGQNKNEEKRTVKIMFWDESYFYQQYGDLFSMKFPNTDVEIVSTNNLYDSAEEGEEFDYDKALAKFIDKEQPDVLLVNAGGIKKLVEDGKLAELQPLIDRDKYDMTTYSQGILESIKEMGEGKLFALGPKFSANGIIYNADLFKKYGVEPPHDGMTWQEILDTARRFPTDGTEKERVYGYGSQYGNNLSELASTIANEQGLKFYNGQTKQITLNTDAWKNVYKMAADAIASKAIYTVTGDGFQGGSMEDYYESQPFLMGRMAMTVDGSYILENIKRASSNMKDYKGFEIGVAAGPVDPSDPTTTNAHISELFAVRAGSPNTDAAWDFVKFVNGEEFAKIKSKTLNNGLPTREGISKEYNGISLEAFYKLKPKMSLDNDNELTALPSSFYEKYRPIMEREIKLLEENKKTVDEALTSIQTEAQAALDQAFKDEEAEKAQKDKK